jgi:hypothetical protein
MAEAEPPPQEPQESEESQGKRWLVPLVIALIVIAVAGFFLVDKTDLIVNHQRVVRVRRTIVPNLRGEPLQTAFGLITSRGLCTGALTPSAPSSGLPGTVVDQHPAPGKEVSELSRVALVVSPGGPVAGSLLATMNPRCPKR